MNLKKRPRVNANPDEKPRITYYSNIIRDLDTLESTQLFTPERFKEIKDYVSEDKFGPVELKNGKHVPDWICHYDTGLMWGIMNNGRGYYIERVLEKFLTTEEIIKINEQANSIRSEIQNKKKFEAAKKVKASEWAGRVCWGDQYYESVEEFEENFIDNFDDSDLCEEDLLLTQDEQFDDNRDYEKLVRKYLPDYVWAVDEEKSVVDFDIDNILEHFTQDTYEDFDSQDLNGQEEFSAAIAKFVEANKEFKMWICNEKIAVMLKE